MKLTKQQEDILSFTDDMIIEAKAGAGKTSTLIEYAKKYPNKKKVYLAFNSSIKIEAEEKFKKSECKNITCSTVHSLGHTYAIKSGKYKLSQFGLSAYHTSKFFGLTDKRDISIISYSIRVFETFCQSPIEKIEDLKYEDFIQTDKARDFFMDNKKSINGYAKLIWDSMFSKKMDCTHSFYLKLYQLSKPKLKYDIFLFDECLPYHTPVLLSDGSSLPIGKIVEDKLQVEVMTYNIENDKDESCKVIGFQKLQNNKKSYRIRSFDSEIVCTENHKVFTYDNGWLEAEKLKVGMNVRLKDQDAVIDEIGEYDLKDEFVYDITVEKNHNFYANGILVHNCQDADPVMLDIFYNQDGQKIMVGDSHQAIYAWRGAINALQSAPEHFKKFYLTHSFRFPQSIADMGLETLYYKFTLDPGLTEELEIVGKGLKTKVETKAVISRSNLALLDILFVEKFKYKKPYIEGGLDSLINSNSGISIVDLYYFSAGKKAEVKNGFVKSFLSVDDLKKYYEDMDDPSINSAINFVRKYGGNLIFELEELKERISDTPTYADYIFSTIHKSKGKEWDEVTIISPDVWEEGFPEKIPDQVTKSMNSKGEAKYDFLTEDQKKIKLKKWIEELNIYYVAVTRAKVKLNHSIPWLEQQRVDDVQYEACIESEKNQDFIKQLDSIKEDTNKVYSFKSNSDLGFVINKDSISFSYLLSSGRTAKFDVSIEDLKELYKQISENDNK